MGHTVVPSDLNPPLSILLRPSVRLVLNDELSLKPILESSLFKLVEILVISETNVVTGVRSAPPVISVMLSSLKIGLISLIFEVGKIKLEQLFEVTGSVEDVGVVV